MNDATAVLVARIISALSTLLVGSFFQILLWHNKTNTIIEALLHFPFLWILYFFIGLLIGEHSLRLLPKSKD